MCFAENNPFTYHTNPQVCLRVPSIKKIIIIIIMGSINEYRTIAYYFVRRVYVTLKTQYGRSAAFVSERVSDFVRTRSTHNMILYRYI